MLLVTLPRSVTPNELYLAERMFEHELVAGARYNTGMAKWLKPKELLGRLQNLATKYNKQFWVDLKMGQLRIAKWGMGEYSNIQLNHRILDLDLPANIYFRGGEWAEIIDYKDNLIVVDPVPKQAVGEGQAVVIRTERLVLDQRLASSDLEYISAAAELGITKFMLSFVEELQDLSEIYEALGGYSHYPIRDVELMLKIESRPGLGFCDGFTKRLFKESTLMAARDDLKISIGGGAEYSDALAMIISKDPNAVCASRIFEGLTNNNGVVTWQDVLDLIRMSELGYKNFMLSDTISTRHFDAAMVTYRQVLPYLKK